ncbi:flavin-containing monooxygenase [Agromyces aurantiacus]|uniref:Flavin-containing monooxygenase n=1 Tax=Agromyces aurantiacus TaxID=165814 RepID=A0ABV9R2B9_9MICO|nr:NAD(P)/FAD-dependent oxidoreductase [Agromyces aurantiacus]MBM7505955.1 putative flavoprotein involved in K+ transport [Agromyces aurantiacus]
MDTTILDTAVVGAGAAGLMVGRRLAERGERLELFDAHARVGDPWRERYRSLRLFTPRPFLELPGLPIGIGRFEYPTGTEMGDYLERYAQHMKLPVRTSTRVVRLSHDGDRFRLELDDGDEVLADRVIVTVGVHQVPITPAFAAELDASIRQVHSLDYRGPEQFADGPVLVVGAGNSGTDVALEAARTGHAVTLAGRHPGHVPVDIDRPLGNLLSGLFIRRLRRLTIDTSKGRAARDAQLGHGVMLIRNSPKDLDRAGIVRVGRIGGVERGRAVTTDGTVIDAATVVWCTGSKPDLGWIDLAGVVGASGFPNEQRGLVTGWPGLAFVGMPFQYSFASPTLMGMDHDAEYVVDALVPARAVAAAATSPAGRRVARRAAA